MRHSALAGYGENRTMYKIGIICIFVFIIAATAIAGLKKHYDGSLLVRAARNNNLVDLKKRMHNNADVNVTASMPGTDLFSKWTALMWAAYHHNSEMMELLVSRGANVEAVDKFGRSPLHLVFDLGNRPDLVDCARILLDNGADPNIADSVGDTPLHKAIRCRSIESVALLIDRGAIMDTPNRAGATALSVAVFELHDATLVEYVLNNGASAHDKLPNGKSIAETVENDKRIPEDIRILIKKHT